MGGSPPIIIMYFLLLADGGVLRGGVGVRVGGGGVRAGGGGGRKRKAPPSTDHDLGYDTMVAGSTYDDWTMGTHPDDVTEANCQGGLGGTWGAGARGAGGRAREWVGLEPMVDFTKGATTLCSSALLLCWVEERILTLYFMRCFL